MATATKKPPAAAKKGKPAPAAAKPAAKAAATAKAPLKTAAKAAPKAEKPEAKAKSKSKKAAAPPPPPPVYVSSFTAGNRVTHPSFGDGKVTAVEGDKLTIQFGKDEKVILDGFVKSAK